MVYGQNKDETGHDGVLIIAGDEIPITNASYDGPDPEYSTVQYNTGLHGHHALTGVRYSGDFEFAGSSEELRQQLYTEASDGKYDIPVTPGSFEIQLEEETEDGTRVAIFTGVAVGTRSRDRPSDDRTTTSYSFMAERMYHKEP